MIYFLLYLISEREVSGMEKAIITDENYEYLQTLARQRTIQAQVVERAKILIYKAQGDANQTIADRLDININTVKLCLNKYKSGGIQKALFDVQRKGRPVEITDDFVSWIINIACQRPADLGYSTYTVMQSTSGSERFHCWQEMIF